MNEQTQNGGCLCGAVTYTIAGPLREVIACHCGQCRKTSGHFVVATSALAEDLTISDNGALRWYRSSPEAERGFCNVCGSSLFWRQLDDDEISIMAGGLDGPTGLTIARHIFVRDAGDYYDIPAGAETFEQDDNHRQPTDG